MPSLTSLLLLLVLPASVLSASPPPAADRAAVHHGLAFLVKDAKEWRQAKTCSTCHHGVMTVWALAEAKGRGYDVSAETLADMTAWTKGRLERIDLPRDTRPGWSMVSTPGLYLAFFAPAIPGQQAVTPDDMRRIAGHLLQHQEADGSWSWAAAPAKNRPPPVFESDEVATLLGYLALGPQAAGQAKEKAAARTARERAAAWLAKTPPSDTTQAAALRLLRKARGGPAAALQLEIDAFLARRNADGGWPQVPGGKSDGYATGQALYVLSLVGVAPDRPEVRRAVAFLTATQRADGSWPMTSRSHPGATPMTNPSPITHFGTAWATIGLLRSIPPRAAAPAAGPSP